MNKEKAGKPPKGQGDEAFVSAECPKLCKTFMGKPGQTGLPQEEETAWRKPDFPRMQGCGAQSCIALSQGLPQAFCTVAAAKKHPGLRISPGCFCVCKGEEISRLIDEGIAISVARPLNVKKLSVNCYSVLIQIADTTHGSRADEPLYRNYVLPIIKEIESSYFLPLTIEKLSRQVFVTPQYLSRLFRRYLNCSAYEYLTSYRLSKAKELLITAPRLEVQEVARRTGFADSSHFIAVFKKAVGVTPLEFRRLN